MEAVAQAESHEGSAPGAAAQRPALPTADARLKGSFAALDSFLKGPLACPTIKVAAVADPSGGSTLPLPPAAAPAPGHPRGPERGLAQAAVPLEAHCATAATAEAAPEAGVRLPVPGLAVGVPAVEEGAVVGPTGGTTPTTGGAVAASGGKRTAGREPVLRRGAAGSAGGGKRVKRLSLQESQTEYVRIATAVKARDPGELLRDLGKARIDPVRHPSLSNQTLNSRKVCKPSAASSYPQQQPEHCTLTKTECCH